MPKHSFFLFFYAAAGAAATFCRGAVLCIGTADALIALLLLADNIKHGSAENCGNDQCDDYSFFHSFKNYFVLPRAYSAAIFLFVFAMRIRITATITTTAQSPQIAGTISRDAGSVISVPTVYTRYAIV